MAAVRTPTATVCHTSTTSASVPLVNRRPAAKQISTRDMSPTRTSRKTPCLVQLRTGSGPRPLRPETVSRLPLTAPAITRISGKSLLEMTNGPPASGDLSRTRSAMATATVTMIPMTTQTVSWTLAPLRVSWPARTSAITATLAAITARLANPPTVGNPFGARIRAATVRMTAIALSA